MRYKEVEMDIHETAVGHTQLLMVALVEVHSRYLQIFEVIPYQLLFLLNLAVVTVFDFHQVVLLTSFC